MGVSDRSGNWYPLDQMRRQLQWAGNKLIDTGLLVGPDEYDTPQPQFRTPILPPDPFPRINPRPAFDVTPLSGPLGTTLPVSPLNQGFTVFTLGVTVGGAGGAVFILDQSILGGPDVLAP